LKIYVVFFSVLELPKEKSLASNKMEGVSIWLPSKGSNGSGMDAIRAGLPQPIFSYKTRNGELGLSKSAKSKGK